MERDTFSWRHLFAFLVTGVAAYGALLLSQMTPRAEPPQQPVMHIRLTPPPPPPLPKIPAKATLPSPSSKVVRARAVNQPNPTIAAAPTAPQTATAAAPPSAPPAAISAPVPPAADISATQEAAYAARLRAAVEAQKHYPTSKDAMIQQPRGTVAIWILLDRQGALVDAGIDQSHGSLLNQAALQSVHRASYPPFPAELYPGQTQHRFVVSLDYAPQ